MPCVLWGINWLSLPGPTTSDHVVKEFRQAFSIDKIEAPERPGRCGSVSSSSSSSSSSPEQPVVPRVDLYRLVPIVGNPACVLQGEDRVMVHLPDSSFTCRDFEELHQQRDDAELRHQRAMETLMEMVEIQDSQEDQAAAVPASARTTSAPPQATVPPQRDAQQTQTVQSLSQEVKWLRCRLESAETINKELQETHVLLQNELALLAREVLPGCQQPAPAGMTATAHSACSQSATTASTVPVSAQANPSPRVNPIQQLLSPRLVQGGPCAAPAEAGTSGPSLREFISCSRSNSPRKPPLVPTLQLPVHGSAPASSTASGWPPPAPTTAWDGSFVGQASVGVNSYGYVGGGAAGVPSEASPRLRGGAPPPVSRGGPGAGTGGPSDASPRVETGGARPEQAGRGIPSMPVTAANVAACRPIAPVPPAGNGGTGTPSTGGPAWQVSAAAAAHAVASVTRRGPGLNAEMRVPSLGNISGAHNGGGAAAAATIARSPRSPRGAQAASPPARSAPASYEPGGSPAMWSHGQGPSPMRDVRSGPLRTSGSVR